MSVLLTCMRGHRWEVDDPVTSPTTEAPALCPVCGLAGKKIPEGAATVAAEAVAALPATGSTTTGRQVDTLPPDPNGEPDFLEPATILSPEEVVDAVVVDWPAVPGYEILGELGRGAMGVVYQARQLRLNRLVALKMILAGAHAGQRELSRFYREAEAVAHLQHPHVVQIYEVGESEGRPFLALEFVDGGSLAARLQHTRVSPREGAELVETLARAVHAAHRRGIVHRDLKPENILLASGGREPPDRLQRSGGARAPLTEFVPKITDFGLAKRLGTEAGQTQSGAIMGTPSYMAPEQAAGKVRDVGAAADIYALGAVLFELLTGQPPFRGETTMETLQQVLTREPVPPSRLRRQVPRDLETICLKCLEKEARRRYASAAALADDLRRFLDDAPVLARPVGQAGRLWRQCRRNPVLTGLMVALVGVVVAGSAIGIWLWHRAEVLGQKVIEMKSDEGNAGQNIFQQATNALTLEGHTDMVTAVAFSPDGKQVASAGWDQMVRLWDPATGKPNLLLKGHTAFVEGLAFSPDGQTLASAGGDQTVRLWETLSGKQTRMLQEHADVVHSVAFSPPGNRLASGSRDQTVKVWDVSAGRELFTLRGHAGPVVSVAFSPDDRHLASASKDGLVRVWDTTTRRTVHTLRGHSGEVSSVAFSPDGRHLASGGTDKTVRIWEAASGAETFVFRGHVHPVHSVAFSPDNRHIASANSRAFKAHEEDLNWAMVKVWETATGRELFTLRGHKGPITGVAFSADGRRLASASKDKTVKVWDPPPLAGLNPAKEK